MAMVEGEWRRGCVMQMKGEHNGEQVLAVNGWLGWKISWRPESRVERLSVWLRFLFFFLENVTG